MKSNEWLLAIKIFLVLHSIVNCVKLEPEKTLVSEDDAKIKAKLILIMDPAFCVHIKSVRTSKESWDVVTDLEQTSEISKIFTSSKLYVNDVLSNSDCRDG